MISLGLGALDLPLFSYVILISFKFKNRCILERKNSIPFTAFVVFLWPSPTNLSPSVAGGASRHARFAGGTRHVNCLRSADGRGCCWTYHRMVLKIVRNSSETNKTLWCGVKITYYLHASVKRINHDKSKSASCRTCAQSLVLCALKISRVKDLKHCQNIQRTWRQSILLHDNWQEIAEAQDSHENIHDKKRHIQKENKIQQQFKVYVTNMPHKKIRLTITANQLIDM